MFRRFLAIFLALLYSIAYIVLGPMVQAQNFHFDRSLLFPFVLCFALCSILNILIFSVVSKHLRKVEIRPLSRFFDALGDRRLFFLIWIFIFASWIPAYLIFYPGILSYDILSQTYNALGRITNNHHPVLHTWLLRVFMRLGDSLFSEYEAGIGLLSLLQMVILSYANARLVLLLKKKNVPSSVVLITALMSALWFTNACLSVTMIKDTLHAAFLVLFTCHFTEIATNPFAYSSKKRNLILFPIIVFLMCALRNNGIHIYVFCLIALAVFRIPQIKKAKKLYPLIGVMLLPVLLFKLYTGPVFQALGIQQGEVREALSVPIQQLQRVAVNKADELTDEQKALEDYYIDNLEWMDPAPGRLYNPFISDPAKSCFYSERYKEDPIAFWKFYLETGDQFTKEYVTAFLSNTLGYWYPGEYNYSYVMYENYGPEDFATLSLEPLTRKSIWDSQPLKNFYKSVCTSSFWRKTPVLRLFFVPGFSLWILLYALALTWRKKGFFTKTLPLFLPLIAQYGIMILSPMASFRYSWPFYLMLPLALIAIWSDPDASCLNHKNVKVIEGDNKDDRKNNHKNEREAGSLA